MRTYQDMMRALWWIPNALTLLRGPIAVVILALFAWDCYARLPTTLGILGSWLSVELALPWFLPHATGPGAYFSFTLFALAITAVALVSDKLDGTLAKGFAHYGWKSDYGAKLDPLMDKWMSYCGLGIVPLYYGVAPYLMLFVPLAWYIDDYSRETTRMRKEGLILEANKYAQHKTGYLFAAQASFIVAIAAEDLVRLESVRHVLTVLSMQEYTTAHGIEAFGYFAFGVALTTMCIAAGLCHFAMRLYRAQAEHVLATRRQQAGVSVQPARA